MIDDEISQIIPHLFLSNWYTSNNTKVLLENEIKAVITLETSRKPDEIITFYKDNKIDFMYIPIEDHPNANIAQYFDVTYHFIKDKISRGENVLVHCRAGVSRSAIIVLNYLVRTYYRDTLHITIMPDEVIMNRLRMMRTRRSIVNPNYGFLRQLHIKALEYANKHEQKNIGVM